MKNVSTVRSRRRSNCQMSRMPLFHFILYRKSIFSCRYRTRMTRLFHFLIKVCLFLLLVLPYPDCGPSFPRGPKIVSGTEITVTPHLFSHSSFAIKRKSYGDVPQYIVQCNNPPDDAMLPFRYISGHSKCRFS